MPLQYDPQPPWSVTVQITVTRPDGDHAAQNTFPIVGSPDILDLGPDDVETFQLVAGMVGHEVAATIMDLVTHECHPDEHVIDPDRMN